MKASELLELHEKLAIYAQMRQKLENIQQMPNGGCKTILFIPEHECGGFSNVEFQGTQIQIIIEAIKYQLLSIVSELKQAGIEDPENFQAKF